MWLNTWQMLRCAYVMSPWWYVMQASPQTLKPNIYNPLACRNLLTATVKRRKLAWLGHVTRHDSLFKTVLQNTLEGERRNGRQRKCWVDNVKEWTSLLVPEFVTMAFRRKKKKKRRERISVGSFLMSPPTTQAVMGLNSCECSMAETHVWPPPPSNNNKQLKIETRTYKRACSDHDSIWL